MDISQPFSEAPRWEGSMGRLRQASWAVACVIAGVAARATATDIVLSTQGTLADSNILLLQGSIPVSGDIEVQFVTPTGITLSEAELYVWPQARASCDTAEPPSALSNPQTYALALTVAESNGRATASATVPHLQTNATFCFRVEWRARVNPVAAEIAQRTSQGVADLANNPQPADQDFARAATDIVAAACGAPAGTTCVPLDPLPLAGTLRARVTASGVHALRTELNAALAAVAAAQAQRTQAIENARGFPDYDAPAAPGEGSLTLTHAWAAADGFGLSQIQQALTRIGDESSAPARRWRDWLLQIRAIVAEHDTHSQEASRLATQEQDARLQLVLSCTQAATEYVTGRLYYERDGYASARAQTGAAANYVSPEGGVAFGFSPTTSNPWFLLYGALNIYFAPVERDIPIGSLVGNPGDIFLQIFSITIAYAGNTAPDIDGGEVQTLFGDGLPGIGFGFRVANFIRLSALAFFYNAAPQSPLSQQELLSAVFCVSASIDVDVIALLTKAIGGG